jgi:hypothetical protein
MWYEVKDRGPQMDDELFTCCGFRSSLMAEVNLRSGVGSIVGQSLPISKALC